MKTVSCIGNGGDIIYSMTKKYKKFKKFAILCCMKNCTVLKFNSEHFFERKVCSKFIEILIHDNRKFVKRTFVVYDNRKSEEPFFCCFKKNT